MVGPPDLPGLKGGTSCQPFLYQPVVLGHGLGGAEGAEVVLLTVDDSQPEILRRAAALLKYSASEGGGALRREGVT